MLMSKNGGIMEDKRPFRTSGNNPIQSTDDLPGYTIYLLNGNTIDDALNHLYMIYSLTGEKFKLVLLGTQYGFKFGFFVMNYDKEQNALVYQLPGDTVSSYFIGNTIIWE